MHSFSCCLWSFYQLLEMFLVNEESVPSKLLLLLRELELSQAANLLCS